MPKNKDKNTKKKYEVEAGFFEDGLTYAKIGDKPNVLIEIEALSFTHAPPSGFRLRLLRAGAQPYLNDYTCYLIGRKPNVPEDYSFTDAANDYARLIRREFTTPVDIMGTSTGGQIAQYLAADHPDVVRKLVLTSTAYRLSERGIEIESKAAEYFEKKKYGRSLAAILDFIWSSRIKRRIAKFFTRIFGGMTIGTVEYPQDFLTEIRGDREMNFKDRLNEIKAPTLVASGETDVGYTAEDVRATAEGIPNAELKLYEGYGHNLMMSNRERVCEDILAFLTKNE
jgi:pimeloyl-ACP methyl ester carboxylesterase